MSGRRAETVKGLRAETVKGRRAETVKGRRAESRERRGVTSDSQSSPGAAMTLFEKPPSPPASETTRHRIAADLEW